MSNKSSAPNRLINESSPYLLQHAYNPVDWYPWGKEAFEKARKEDKPIFLSIGYSTCHWCHVMEKESFEDPEVAKLLNDVCVPIKVDREERPDIDHIYMAVCQVTTGSGGWPLNILMSCNKEPFFAGTYFPKHSRFGRMGLVELLTYMKGAWKEKKKEILNSAFEITKLLGEISKTNPIDGLDKSVVDLAYKQLRDRYDPVHGGFGSAPKFPSPQTILFLLRYYKNSLDTNALQMAEKTLTKMRLGGIYDHIGFGFHRYSTDSNWLLPHFEKMLYDQAMLVMVYTEAYQITGSEFYKQTASDVIDYVLRDMTSDEGGFFAAEDADSEGEEGKFYIWTDKEIRTVLGKDADLFIKAYSVKEDGNFYDEATKQKIGLNILHLSKTFNELAFEFSMPLDELQAKLNDCRSKLFDVREKRVHPGKDDKILVDWNGLMIAALSKAGIVFDKPGYIEASKKATTFINKHLIKDKKLLHSYGNGSMSGFGNVDDYSFFVWGLIELYEATLEFGYLNQALELTDYLIKHFWDSTSGGFYFVSDEAERVLVRKKEFYDGAIPSGNSVAMNNLLRLGHMTNNNQFLDYANKGISSFGEDIKQLPSAFSWLMCALNNIYSKSFEIIVAGDKNDVNFAKGINVINKVFCPNKVLLYADKNNEDLKDYKEIDGKPTYYVCENYKCDEPTTDINKVLEKLL